MKEECPKCGVSLIGDPIPEDIAHHYSGTHWLRKIGIYDRDQDRTVAWKCPDCDHEWDRCEESKSLEIPELGDLNDILKVEWEHHPKEEPK